MSSVVFMQDGSAVLTDLSHPLFDDEFTAWIKVKGFNPIISVETRIMQRFIDLDNTGGWDITTKQLREGTWR